MSLDYLRTFEIVKRLDKARFENLSTLTGRSSLINYFNGEIMSPESRLLTHWLCYITDRQMPFEKVWDVGGFIFSQLAYQFCEEERTAEELLSCNKPGSFFRCEYIDPSELKNDNKEQDNKNKEPYRFYFAAPYDKAGKNADKSVAKEALGILKSERKGDEKVVPFKPRYYPADYRSIYYTLYALKKFGGFKGFINQTLDAKNEKGKELLRLLHALHYITYYDIKPHPLLSKKNDQNKYKKITTINNEDELNDLINIFNNEMRISAENRRNVFDGFDSYIKNGIFSSKRAICSLRDFLQAPEFQKDFIELIGQRNFDLLKGQLNTLELPGDVWNNRDGFWDCSLGYPFLIDGSKVGKTAQKNWYIRQIYDELKKLEDNVASPVQFDFTFDFVQRMCDKGNCRVCVFQKEAERDLNAFEKLCIYPINGTYHGDHYCPVLMLYCGYAVPCGENICIREVFRP